MGRIVSARAYCNNEVAYLAWDIDAKIRGCLGFDVTRVYLDENGEAEDGADARVRCATWVAFKGQRNKHWLPQDTSVWPVQKLAWRDLTLRKRRKSAERRPDEVRVRYEIRPVGDFRPGLEAVPPNGQEFGYITKRDADGKPVLGPDGKPIRIRVKAYEGAPRPLGYLAPPTVTNDILVTSRQGPFRTTFTNGILAAQWLRNVLLEDGAIQPNELINKIKDKSDPHRKYLAGDVIPLIRELLERKGTFYLGLYELEDEELELLLTNSKIKNRIHVILSNTGLEGGEWDARNKAARKRLIDAGVDVTHRMFNNSIHIGHNKFVIHVPPGGGPRSVLTGSTNWTSTGLAGQTNNALLIEDDDVAGGFLTYWRRLKGDVLPEPAPFGNPMKDNQPGESLRKKNQKPVVLDINAGTITTWFAPNMPQRKKPESKTKPPPTPPDLAFVYSLMRKAEKAILFLAFYPGQSGRDCIIGEAIDIGLKDRSLLVQGAVSSAQAMPNYVPKKQTKEGEVVDEGESPATFDDRNVSIVRASRIDDRRIAEDFGAEQLTARGAIGAIIHDKIMVIDPLSDNCHVILGSHNLGFKASYSNDENMLIVSRNKQLAMAYAVHILDVYDHYRFRAIEAERKRQGKTGWSGFLATDDSWQDGYVERRKGAMMRYFAG